MSENINNGIASGPEIKDGIPSDATKKETGTDLEKGKQDFKEFWLPRLTLVISVAALMISLFSIVTRDDDGIRNFFNNISENDRIIILISNLIVSLIAFIFLAKQTPVNYSIQDKAKFKSLAELNENANIDNYTTNLNNRVNTLVNQFRFHMALFAFSLALVYGIILLSTLNEISTNSFDTDRKLGYFPIITNLINLIGALFVQLGFSVLYNKTLQIHKDSKELYENSITSESDQRRLETEQILTYNSSLYWGIPLLCFVFYALIFISLSISQLGNYDKDEVTHFLNIFDLMTGSANGLAMSLLFGRYVSIEQSMRDTKLFNNVFKHVFQPFSFITYKALVSLGIIFILPVYALAQPLFGSLKIDEFGSPRNFQTIVYAICLLGKICFLHLTYILISKKLLHLYLYGLVSEVGNFKELEKCFNTKTQE